MVESIPSKDKMRVRFSLPAPLKDLIYVLVIAGFGYGGFYCGSLSERANHISAEQSDDCYDTPKYDAWIAKKNGEYRCFFESTVFPHRVRASYIEITP